MEALNAEAEKRAWIILVADDQPVILQYVSTVLEKSGYTVLTAPTGEEALLKSRAFDGEIDLLLSNIQMPGMTGMDLGTSIIQERPNIKVVIMAGFRSGMLVLDHSWHFLQKPFIPSQLREIIAGMLLLPPNPSLDGPPSPNLEEPTIGSRPVLAAGVGQSSDPG